MNLNPVQRKLVEADPNGYSLIRGVAGSGKTTVALHRTLFLSRNFCFEDGDRVLLVTYNRTLIKYLQYLYEKLEQKNCYGNIFFDEDQAVDVRTVDSLIYKYVLDAVKDIKFPSTNQKYTILKECITELRKSLNHSILDQKNASFLLNEIEWIKACNYMELEEYQHADRVGRQIFESDAGSPRLVKNSPARQAIYELMLVYSQKLTARGFVDFLDCALAALQCKEIEEENRYTHIIVDEAQDFTRVQWEFLKRLYKPKKYSSFTVIMDTAQSIYPHAWLVKGRSFTSIGIDIRGKSHILSKSYRNTREIARSAYALIAKDDHITGDENFVPPVAIDKRGCEPVWRCFANEKDEAVYVAERIKELLAEGYTYKDMAVIARQHNQLDYLQEYLQELAIPCYRPKKSEGSVEDDTLNLLTLHAVKGLEFKVVFIVGLTDEVMPFIPSQAGHEDKKLLESNERKLLYVGMTRATEALFLSSSGKPSRFIRSITGLRLNHRMKIKAFYRVNPDDYLFRDKLSNPWSDEEKVRQWMLKELMNTYGYPRSTLDLEYKVNRFSQTGGSVDIVVYTVKKGSRVPYIFVETKSPDSDLSAGRRQLESYMSNCRVCRYGVLTNGMEVLILDQDFSVLEDIPVYTSSTPSESIQRYFYKELMAFRGRRFMVDGASPDVIVEERDGEGEKREYGGSELIKLPVFYSIAAGAPSFVNDRAEDQFYLPREWVKHGENLFMLKVEGDSMEGAGIHDGDFVLVRKQDSVENTDIVVAMIEEEATLKGYEKSGDQTLLVPKNEKYTPIKVKTEQSRILGKVLAVIKPVIH